MAFDSLGEKEYMTFTTSRRDDVFENRKMNSYAFKHCPPVKVKRNDCCKKEVHFNPDVRVLDRTTILKMA